MHREKQLRKSLRCTKKKQGGEIGKDSLRFLVILMVIINHFLWYLCKQILI